MARIKFENGTTVNFEGNPTPQDVEEVANRLGIQSANPPVETQKGFIPSVKQRLGESIAQRREAFSNIDPNASRFSRALRGGAEITGLGSNLVTAPIAETFSRIAAMPIEPTGKGGTIGENISKLFSAVGSIPTGRKTNLGDQLKAAGELVSTNYQKFKQSYPDLEAVARNLGSSADIATTGELGGQTARLAGKAVKKSVQIPKSINASLVARQPQAINELEQTYIDLMSGTTPGKKKIAKIATKTEMLNRAGTEGKTPMRTLAEEGILPKREGTKLDTFDQANAYREKIKPLRDANRQALEETGLSTQPRKLDDLEIKAIEYAKTPQNINSGRFYKMEKEIQAEFSLLREYYPTGEISLSKVDDIKSARWDNVFKNKSLIEADALKKDSEYAIAKALQKDIEEVAVRSGNTEVAQLNREIGDRLEAAKFLEDLNGKTIKGGRLLKYVTTAIGSSLGKSLPGKLIGALGGNLVGELIIANNVANPIKRLILRNLERTNPEAYTKTLQWLEKQNLDRETRLLLTAPQNKGIPSVFSPTPPTTYEKGFPPTNYAKQPELLFLPPSTRAPESQVIRLKGNEPTTYEKPAQIINYVNQSKSPTAQQTIPAIKSESKIPIVKNTIPLTPQIVKPKTSLARDIFKTGEKKSNLNLKRDVTVTTLSGEKVVIPEGEALSAYEKGGKALLKDGREYIVSKSQYENIKNNSLKSEAKEFAPELKGTEETIKSEANRQARDLDDIAMEMYGKKLEDLSTLEGIKVRSAQGKRMESPTKFSQYQLPGDKNYKEVLIKAPTSKPINKTSQLEGGGTVRELGKENLPIFKSSHWDEPNVISHLRLNERTYKGKKVTFMEELQSDWAREARKNPFVSDPSVNEYLKLSDNYGDLTKAQEERFYKLEGELDNKYQMPNDDPASWLREKLKGTPNNPLLKNWQELSVKRALKEAVDNNSEYLAWTTGEQQAARYNLAKQVDNITWRTTSGQGGKSVTIKPTGSKEFTALIDKEGKIVTAGGGIPSDWMGKRIDEAVGKGIGEKILKDETGNLSGEGLNIGGEWANTLYGNAPKSGEKITGQVKNIVEDITGHRVETIDLGLPIEAKGRDFRIITDAKKTLEREPLLTEKNIKVGQEITTREKFEPYIITDILGDGKFKAVPKKDLLNATEVGARKNQGYKKISENYYHPNLSQTFDISTKKSAGQQAIKITPEIRALVKGEAPMLKQPSGKIPFMPKKK